MVTGRFQRVNMVPMYNNLQWLIVESPSNSQSNWYHISTRLNNRNIDSEPSAPSGKEK
jgi:hypothetical protein